MNKEQVESWLHQICDGKDWFHSVGWDQYGRAVVYVKYMNTETLNLIPDLSEDRRQVLTHFATSITSHASDFMNKPQEKLLGVEWQFVPKQITTNPSLYMPGTATTPSLSVLAQDPSILAREVSVRNSDAESALSPEEEERLTEMRVQALTDELDKLERICGSNILSDIFFETHDKGNAVTNLSAKFPDVRQRMENLYSNYGFDIIYDELEL